MIQIDVRWSSVRRLWVHLCCYISTSWDGKSQTVCSALDSDATCYEVNLHRVPEKNKPL